MNLSLSMIVRSDAAMLKLTLPVLAPYFTEKVAVLFPSKDDSGSVLRSFGFSVVEREWPHSYADARNLLLSQLRQQHSEPWTLMLDADELVWPMNLETLSRLAAYCRHPIIALPRFNLATPSELTLEETLVQDRMLWEESSFPDLQLRLVRVASKVEYRNQVHECPYPMGSQQSYHQLGCYGQAATPIYHYGSCKPLPEVWLKHHNYGLMRDGQPTIDSCPLSEADLRHLTHRELLPPFRELHPLIPHAP